MYILMIKLWGVFFYTTFFYAFIGNFIHIFIYEEWGGGGVEIYKMYEKIIFIVIFLVMWGFGFARAAKAKSKIRKSIMFTLCIITTFASGYIFYIYDRIRKDNNE